MAIENGPSIESFKEPEQRMIEAEDIEDAKILEQLPEIDNIDKLAADYYAELRIKKSYKGKIPIEDLPETKDKKPTREEKLAAIGIIGTIEVSRAIRRSKPLLESDPKGIRIDKTGFILIPRWDNKILKSGEERFKKNPVYYISPDIQSTIRMQDHIVEDNYGLALTTKGPGEVDKLLEILGGLEEARRNFWNWNNLSEEEQKETFVKIAESRASLSKNPNLLRNEFKREVDEILEGLLVLSDDLKQPNIKDSLDRPNPIAKAMKTWKAQNRGQFRIDEMMSIAPEIAKRKQALVDKKLSLDHQRDILIQTVKPQIEEIIHDKIPARSMPGNFDDQEAQVQWIEDTDNLIREKGLINESNAPKWVQRIKEKIIRPVITPGDKLDTLPYIFLRDNLLEALVRANAEIDGKPIARGSKKRIRNIPEAKEYFKKALGIVKTFENLDKVFAKREK